METPKLRGSPPVQMAYKRACERCKRTGEELTPELIEEKMDEVLELMKEKSKENKKKG